MPVPIPSLLVGPTPSSPTTAPLPLIRPSPPHTSLTQGPSLPEQPFRCGCPVRRPWQRREGDLRDRVTEVRLTRPPPRRTTPHHTAPHRTTPHDRTTPHHATHMPPHKHHDTTPRRTTPRRTTPHCTAAIRCDRTPSLDALGLCALSFRCSCHCCFFLAASPPPLPLPLSRTPVLPPVLPSPHIQPELSSLHSHPLLLYSLPSHPLFPDPHST